MPHQLPDNFVPKSLDHQNLNATLNDVIEQSRQLLYAKDMCDPEVPDFVKNNNLGDSQNDDNDDDYTTDEEYEVSTRVDQSGQNRQVVQPTANMMKKSIRDASIILHESFREVVDDQKNGQLDREGLDKLLKNTMAKVGEKRLTQDMILQMLETVSNYPKDTINQVLTNFKNSAELGTNKISQKYRKFGNKFDSF